MCLAHLDVMMLHLFPMLQCQGCSFQGNLRGNFEPWSPAAQTSQKLVLPYVREMVIAGKMLYTDKQVHGRCVNVAKLVQSHNLQLFYSDSEFKAST